MKVIKFVALIVALGMVATVSAQHHRKLWTHEPSVHNSHAEMIVFKADSNVNTGAAVIICPGGSYHHLGMPHEGYKVAKWFNKKGINAFVLRYRVSMFGHHYPTSIEDFQQAMRLIRENAQSYGIDATRVGAIGFSAGGHLVTMAGACYKDNYLDKLGIQTTVSLRPDWVAAIYPVVSMQDSIAHLRSQKFLLGQHSTQEMKNKLSMELNIPNDMPPTYVQASKDDPVVNYRNSAALANALKNKNIPYRFMLFDFGGHGYGMKNTEFTKTTQWNETLYEWIKKMGLN